MAARSVELDARYGKQNVPVFKIIRKSPDHAILDTVVNINLRGDVADSWRSGDNHQIVPTETQKNTCYAVAAKTEFDCVEDYGVALGRDILSRHKHIQEVDLQLEERIWERVEVGGKPHAHAFTSCPSPVKRTCKAAVTRRGVEVTSGVKDLKFMKTTQSGFKDFITDKYTNLQPVGGAGSSSPDRIMCTEMEAEWTYTAAHPRSFRTTNADVMATIIDTWAGPAKTGTFSKSVQDTAFRCACAVLDRFPNIREVYIAAPNIHFYPYPLDQFGISNPNVVFQSTDCHTTASGRIETRVKRPQSKL